MNKNLKIGLILLIIASVLLICSTLAFFILKEAEKEKRMYLADELKKVISAKESLGRDLEEIKMVNRELESKIDSARERALKIAQDLAKEKEERQALAVSLEKEREKSDGLMADIMAEKEKRLELVRQLSKADEAYRKLREQFNIMVEAKETLEAKIKEMLSKKGVELERIEVKSGYNAGGVPEKKLLQSNTRPGGPGAGVSTVLVVNKKFNFIVANIGKSNGAGMGTIFDIYRGGEFIAKARVEKLYSNMSASTILPEWKDASIKEGDQVYFSD